MVAMSLQEMTRPVGHERFKRLNYIGMCSINMESSNIHVLLNYIGGQFRHILDKYHTTSTWVEQLAKHLPLRPMLFVLNGYCE